MAKGKAIDEFKRKRFVHEYIVTLSASKAAVRAGYAAKYGAKLLQDDAVHAEINRKLAQLNKSCTVTVHRIIDSLARIAFNQADEHIRVRERLRALEMLCKHLGMFSEQQQITVVESDALNALAAKLDEKRAEQAEQKVEETQ